MNIHEFINNFNKREILNFFDIFINAGHEIDKTKEHFSDTKKIESNGNFEQYAINITFNNTDLTLNYLNVCNHTLAIQDNEQTIKIKKLNKASDINLNDIKYTIINTDQKLKAILEYKNKNNKDILILTIYRNNIIEDELIIESDYFTLNQIKHEITEYIDLKMITIDMDFMFISKKLDSLLFSQFINFLIVEINENDLSRKPEYMV